MTDSALQITRLLTATPEALWRCWVEADLLRQWFAPAPVLTTRIEIAPHPGGRFFFEMQIPDHGLSSGEGCVLVALPNQRLIWTNCLTAGFIPQIVGTGETDFGMTAQIDLVPEGRATRYTARVFHANPQDAQKHAKMGFVEGWGAATDQLEALASTL